jgi:hypothetical protein
VRFKDRLRRCRHCGIRVPRDEMRYDQLACSEECANEIWIKQQSETAAACGGSLHREELDSHVLAS